MTGEKETSARSAAMQLLERSLWKRADVSIYPSDEEAAVVRELEPDVAVMSVMPFAFDHFGERRKPVSGCDILFVAGFGHPPNEDGAVWFVEHIFPEIRRKVPAARILIVGSNPTARVRSLANGVNAQSVELHSNVTDEELARFYTKARVAVVPLRFGAGVKLKVIEALKDGVPLVTTPVGAQGCMDLHLSVPVITDAQNFAEEVIKLLEDDEAWSEANERQLVYARKNFSTETLRSSLRAVFPA